MFFESFTVAELRVWLLLDVVWGTCVTEMLLGRVARVGGTWALLDAVAGGGIFMSWSVFVSVAEGTLVVWAFLDAIAWLWEASVLLHAAGVGRERNWVLLGTIISDIGWALEEGNTAPKGIWRSLTLLNAVAGGTWGTWAPLNCVRDPLELRWLLNWKILARWFCKACRYL